MVRTSRCFASDFSQLGGPEALVSRSGALARRLLISRTIFQEVSHGGPGDPVGQTETGCGEDIG